MVPTALSTVLFHLKFTLMIDSGINIHESHSLVLGTSRENLKCHSLERVLVKDSANHTFTVDQPSQIDSGEELNSPVE